MQQFWGREKGEQMNKNILIKILRNIRRKYKEKVKKYKVKGSYAIQIDEIDDRAIKEAITIIKTKDIDIEEENNHIPKIDWKGEKNG